jgi:hypothetical protein
VIWLKTGADKRRVNSKEELCRLFLMSAQFHADELSTKAGLDKLDKLRFRDFLRDVYKQEYPDSPAGLTRLLQNMNPAIDDGCLFTATVHRKPVEELGLVDKGALKVQIKGQGTALSGQPDLTKESLPDNVLKRDDHNVGKASGKILEACRERSVITIPELAALILKQA